MKVKRIKLSIKLLAMIGLLSLGIAAQNAAKKELGQERWHLTEINGRRVGQTKAFLEIDQTENRFGGNAGCNRMFGKARITGRKVDFSGIGTTKMFCGEAGAMKLENDFTAALDRATRFEARGDVLKLFAGNRLILKFKAVAGEDSNSGAVKLEDKKWVLESIKGDKLPEIEIVPFIIFNGSEKSAGGNTSCNVFGGNYEASGEKISITNIISTMRACIEDERMNVEREFKNGLENADRYEIAKGRLNLYQGRTLLLSFRGENK